MAVRCRPSRTRWTSRAKPSRHCELRSPPSPPPSSPPPSGCRCVLLFCSEGGGFSFVTAAVGTLSSGAVRLVSGASARVPCKVSRVLGGKGRSHCIATWRVVATSHWIATWRAATLYRSMPGRNRLGRSRRNSPPSLSTSLRTTPSDRGNGRTGCIYPIRRRRRMGAALAAAKSALRRPTPAYADCCRARRPRWRRHRHA